MQLHQLAQARVHCPLHRTLATVGAASPRPHRTCPLLAESQTMAPSPSEPVGRSLPLLRLVSSCWPPGDAHWLGVSLTQRVSVISNRLLGLQRRTTLLDRWSGVSLTRRATNALVPTLDPLILALTLRLAPVLPTPIADYLPHLWAPAPLQVATQRAITRVFAALPQRPQLPIFTFEGQLRVWMRPRPQFRQLAGHSRQLLRRPATLTA
jgi:hypothetical protein